MNKFKNIFLILLITGLIGSFGLNLTIGQNPNFSSTHVLSLAAYAIIYGIILPPFLLQLSLENLKNTKINLSVSYVFKNFGIALIQGIFGVLAAMFLGASILIIYLLTKQPSILPILFLALTSAGSYFFIQKFFQIYLWQNHFALYFNEFKKSHKKTVSNFKKTFKESLLPFAIVTLLPIVLSIAVGFAGKYLLLSPSDLTQNLITFLSILFNTCIYTFYYFKTTEITLKNNASTSKK